MIKSFVHIWLYQKKVVLLQPNWNLYPPISAALAELVDALDLGSSFERSEGSSPLCRTSGPSDPIFLINN